ncbi:MAG: murein hydrolase activator EnvC family protein [Tumebacillaceae bacterium]
MQHRKSRLSKTIAFGVSSVLAMTLFAPQGIAAADLNGLKDQQGQKQQELNDAKKREQDAKNKKQQFQQQIDVNAASINKLAAQIDEKENQITQLQGQIFLKNQEIDKTQQELTAAEKRVKDRDTLLKERLRMMYVSGDVQYMDVLLNSTSFSDFLDRFDALSLIFKQDTEILRQNKEDRDLVAVKKKQLEDQKVSLNKDKANQEDQKTQLDGMKAQKEAINRQLASNRDEQARIEKEEEKMQNSAIAAIYELQKQIDAEQYKQNTTPTNGDGGNQTHNGPFGWPLPGHNAISSDYGVRIDPFTGEPAGHNGLDIPAPEGTPIAAAQSGTVITAGEVSGFGNCVIINHGNGLWTLYGHIVNGGILVSVGQQVNKGDIIAKVGTTGRSTGPHLHFGVYVNGATVNPHQYL